MVPGVTGGVPGSPGGAHGEPLGGSWGAIWAPRGPRGWTLGPPRGYEGLWPDPGWYNPGAGGGPKYTLYTIYEVYDNSLLEI